MNLFSYYGYKVSHNNNGLYLFLGQTNPPEAAPVSQHIVFIINRNLLFKQYIHMIAHHVIGLYVSRKCSAKRQKEEKYGEVVGPCCTSMKEGSDH